jgi:predicted SnoaL-like aldol condensation-catalyzing enzyme
MKERNEDIIRRWFQEVWNERKVATIEELTIPDLIGHHEMATSRRREDFVEFHANILALVPDIRVEVEDVLADENTAVARWRFSGTAAASGEPVAFSGISWVRIVDGRIVEGWDRWNPAPVLAAQAAALARAGT